MAFRATPEDVEAGLAAQAKVLAILNEYHDSPDGWQESRQLIRYDNPYISEADLNFEENRTGDLVNRRLDLAMEVQHSERTDNCLWMRSKYLHCRAQLQCFSFKRHGAYLVIESKVLRDYIDEWNVEPTPGDRDSYYTWGIDVLLKLGATDLIEWCESQRVPIEKYDHPHTPGYCICGG